MDYEPASRLEAHIISSGKWVLVDEDKEDKMRLYRLIGTDEEVSLPYDRQDPEFEQVLWQAYEDMTWHAKQFPEDRRHEAYFVRVDHQKILMITGDKQVNEAPGDVEFEMLGLAPGENPIWKLIESYQSSRYLRQELAHLSECLDKAQKEADFWEKVARKLVG